MSINALNERITKQQERLQQLKAQKQALESKTKQKQKEKKKNDDTRRKILLGAYLLKKMNDSETAHQRILAELDGYLVENRDRKLFGLPDIIEVKPNHEPELEQSKLDL